MDKFQIVTMIVDLSVERVILSLKGNVWNFMNAICTKDLLKFQHQPSERSLRAFMLNSNGRIVTDLLISKPVQWENELLIEIPESLLDNFQNLIEKLNFRQTVQTALLNELKPYGILLKERSPNSKLKIENNSRDLFECLKKTCSQELLDLLRNDLIFPHPNGLGWRLYTKNYEKIDNTDSINSWHRSRVLEFGIPESSHMILLLVPHSRLNPMEIFWSSWIYKKAVIWVRN